MAQHRQRARGASPAACARTYVAICSRNACRASTRSRSASRKRISPRANDRGWRARKPRVAIAIARPRHGAGRRDRRASLAARVDAAPRGDAPRRRDALGASGRGEPHAEPVRGRGEAVVDRLALAVERRERALDRRARDARRAGRGARRAANRRGARASRARASSRRRARSSRRGACSSRSTPRARAPTPACAARRRLARARARSGSDATRARTSARSGPGVSAAMRSATCASIGARERLLGAEHGVGRPGSPPAARAGRAGSGPSR